jgi:hypothetical protein
MSIVPKFNTAENSGLSANADDEATIRCTVQIPTYPWLLS